ncbi:MAG: right-handed parallel beta-helix repeat-containing protein [Akkermansiaceae bacterium]|nr:right-handed parallel beta-helix repeat-containing protein [Akkermansiaceae bacterium]
MAFSMVPSGLFASVLHVDRDATGSEDGSSWANAFSTLNAALDAAVAGDQIWIAAGIYYPNDEDPSDISRSQSFQLVSQVTVLGGFAGTETDAASRDPVANPTVLSADLGRDDTDTDGDGVIDYRPSNGYHVLENDQIEDAVLEGVTIEGGAAMARSRNDDVSGGGMVNLSSSVTLRDCIFLDNRVVSLNGTAQGGAVYQADSDCLFERCTFVGNYADSIYESFRYGGAVYNASSSVSFVDCTFTNSNAVYGGAIFSSGSDVVIDRCEFTGNAAEVLQKGVGGAIWHSGQSLVISGSIFRSNTAARAVGAVNCENAIVVVTDTTFESNTAAGSGGGMYCSQSQAVFERCVFNSNESGDAGGGLVVYSGTVEAFISDSSFIDNVAEKGGGLVLSANDAEVSRCTFSGNRAFRAAGGANVISCNPRFANCTFYNNEVYGGGSGGGSGPSAPPDDGGGGAMRCQSSTVEIIHGTFYSNRSNFRHLELGEEEEYSGGLNADDSTPVVRNSIFWDNEADDIYGSTATVSNSIIDGGYPGTGVSTADPLLGSFGAHGGLTSTVPVAFGSPAIDAGVVATDDPATDQRGFSRDGEPDLGACEFTALAVESFDTTPYVRLGSSARLLATSDHALPSFQWYLGESGDTSTPLTSGAEHLTEQLEFGTQVWVQLLSAATGSVDSETMEISVRGNYEDWCAFHQLSGADAAPLASLSSDGIANILKFATGLDPSKPEVLPVTIHMVGDHFECSATISTTPLDITAGFRKSTNLEQWAAPSAVPSITATGPGFHRMDLTEPCEHPIGFMRFEAGFAGASGIETLD